MMIFVTWDNWMNVENIVLSELRQTGKAWFYMCFHYVECEKVKITSSRQVDGGYLGLGGWEEGEMLVKRYRFEL